MQNEFQAREFQARALRLLAEDAQLTAALARVLHTLVTASPVALRGEETMVPVATLLARLRSPREWRREWRREDADADADANALREALERIAAAQWRMPSWRGVASGTFIGSYRMGRDAMFLHFQVDDGFIDALNRIAGKLASDARDLPSGGGH